VPSFDSRHAESGQATSNQNDASEIDASKGDASAASQRLPNLHAYYQRIGAREKTFRRAVVEDGDDHGYRRIVATIAIKNGTIECSDAALEPTEGERVAIEREIASADWPKSTNARFGSRPEQLRNASNRAVYEFRSRDGWETLFIQERVERDDGSKSYIPWSFWSDGKWRRMEPDGFLPLFGLDQLNGGGPVMIHEGAKAARFCQWLASDDPEAIEAAARHPWGDQLRHRAHLGWVGGAPNPNRTDWSPMKNLASDFRVTIVCDNDRPGVDAAVRISSILRRPLEVLRFGNAFPTGFDLADDFPAKMWR